MQTKFFLSAALLLTGVFAQAQTFYTQDFESTALSQKPIGWSSKVFNVYGGRGVNNSRCIQSSFGTSASFDTLSSDYQVMPAPPLVYSPLILQFQYRITDYIGATPIPAPLPVGSKIEVFAEQNGGAYTLVKTITQSPTIVGYVTSGEIQLPDAFFGREVRIIFRVTNTGGSGASYVVQFDDITLGIALIPVATNDRKIAEGAMHITPNPIRNGRANLRVEGATQGDANLNITDIAGKTIAAQTIQILNNTAIAVEMPSAAGIYFVTATTTNGAFTQRVVVE